MTKVGRVPRSYTQVKVALLQHILPKVKVKNKNKNTFDLKLKSKSTYLSIDRNIWLIFLNDVFRLTKDRKLCKCAKIVQIWVFLKMTMKKIITNK